MSRRIRTRIVQRWLWVSPLVALAACGGPQVLGEAGEACFRDDECVAGLICVAPEEGSIERVCSNDPTPLISNVDGPPVMEPMGGTAGMAGTGGMAGDMAVAGGGMGAMAGGGAASAGSAGTDSGGTDMGGSSGSGGGGMAGTGGATAGSAGSGGTEPEGGAAN